MGVIRIQSWLAALLLLSSTTQAQPLTGTQPWTLEGDAAAEMVSGIGRWLDDRIDATRAERQAHWQEGLSQRPNEFLSTKRSEWERYIGAIDGRPGSDLRVVSPPAAPPLCAMFAGGSVATVEWSAFGSVTGEGFLLRPNGVSRGNIILLLDCDDKPEWAFGLGSPPEGYRPWAADLCSMGFTVLAPALVDRGREYAGRPEIRMTNQSHREYIYRGAFEMGRHVAGYEINMMRAAIDWFDQEGELPVGVAGMGEGAFLALSLAALDTRIDACLVSGYFGPRENVWSEPIYRNVWRQLTAFGDAELAALIAPRVLIVEDAPLAPGIQRWAAGFDGEGTPGGFTSPTSEQVTREIERANGYLSAVGCGPVLHTESITPLGPHSLSAFAKTLSPASPSDPGEAAITAVRTLPEGPSRTKRLVDAYMAHNQALMHESRYVRKDYWRDADASSVDSWVSTAAPYRERFYTDVIGKLPDIALPPNARSRLYCETDAFTGYEILLDVYDNVIAYGILLVPKGMAEGEQRPVVVCQHGLEGRPQEVADPTIDSHYYHQYGCKLAEEGFVVYAPQNPYIGGDDFRVLQRKANPLGLSLFSFITRQHEQTLGWLKTLPFVDGSRMAFYGLSYGGKTAIRVPALLPDYCLSICSGDFNEWIWKTVSDREPLSYQFTGEYEMYEFNMGNTCNYAELSWLIFPRPFMVERGHDDGVSTDEWVSYEYARTRYRYDTLGLGDRTEIGYFNGPHTIHGVETFAFLRKHLNWPE